MRTLKVNQSKTRLNEVLDQRDKSKIRCVLSFDFFLGIASCCSSKLQFNLPAGNLLENQSTQTNQVWQIDAPNQLRTQVLPTPTGNGCKEEPAVGLRSKLSCQRGHQLTKQRRTICDGGFDERQIHRKSELRSFQCVIRKPSRN